MTRAILRLVTLSVRSRCGGPAAVAIRPAGRLGLYRPGSDWLLTPSTSHQAVLASVRCEATQAYQLVRASRLIRVNLMRTVRRLLPRFRSSRFNFLR
jgi:hypothetical protein